MKCLSTFMTGLPVAMPAAAGDRLLAFAPDDPAEEPVDAIEAD